MSAEDKCETYLEFFVQCMREPKRNIDTNFRGVNVDGYVAFARDHISLCIKESCIDKRQVLYWLYADSVQRLSDGKFLSIDEFVEFIDFVALQRL